MKMFQNPLADFDAPDPFMIYAPVMGTPWAKDTPFLPPSGERDA